jgi:chromosome segregation ATPase
LLEQELTEKEEQINKAGLFQVSLKDTLKKEIKKTQEKITTMNNELIDIEEKIRIVLEVIEPVETRVKEYTTELDRITEKYYILNLK